MPIDSGSCGWLAALGLRFWPGVVTALGRKKKKPCSVILALQSGTRLLVRDEDADMHAGEWYASRNTRVHTTCTCTCTSTWMVSPARPCRAILQADLTRLLPQLTQVGLLWLLQTKAQRRQARESVWKLTSYLGSLHLYGPLCYKTRTAIHQRLTFSSSYYVRVRLALRTRNLMLLLATTEKTL